MAFVSADGHGENSTVCEATSVKDIVHTKNQDVGSNDRPLFKSLDLLDSRPIVAEDYNYVEQRVDVMKQDTRCSFESASIVP